MTTLSRNPVGVERKALAEVLERVGGNRAEASRILKVSDETLQNKISELGLEQLRARPDR